MLVVVDEGVEIELARGRVSFAGVFLGERSPEPPTVVVNLCASYAHHSVGYYVSLLAEARGHRAFPSVATLRDLEHRVLERPLSTQVAPLLARFLRGVTSDRITLRVYFGKSPTRGHVRLAAELFRWFPVPLLRVELRRHDGGWRLHRVRALSLSDLPARHLDCFSAAAAAFAERSAPTPPRRRVRARVAILYPDTGPSDGAPWPSNQPSLARFVRAAEREGLSAELLPWSRRDRVRTFDGLFLRVLTVGDAHGAATYRLVRRMEARGLVVVDAPDSIVRCTNKAYLADVFKRSGVPTPATLVVSRATLQEAEEAFGYPCVLKSPDGFDSLGVVRVRDRRELFAAADALFARSHLIVAQAFMQTEFDWRIGVFDGVPIWASRYYMAHGHWQIVKRVNGRVLRGRDDSVRLADVPREVVDLALRAAALVGDSLYGVDLKVIDGKCYCVEVNDNPSINHGVEDRAEPEELYARFMRGFARRLAGGGDAR